MKWNRKIAATLLFFAPGIVSALGLGNIELDSGLNQPFEARIELISVTADELNSLRIGLADAEAFRRANIERVFVLSQLRFEIVETDTGSDYIRAYSQDSIREPFLHFLIEASWSSGRLYREYTVLLDPPLYDPNSRQPAAFSTPAPAPTPTRSFTPTPVVEETPSSTYVPDYTGNEYGPISSGDTLWSIASQTRPDSSVSVQQMMLALQRSNPEAFIEGNINGLKRGQVLRIPDSGEIDSINQSAALEQVRSQNNLWQDTRSAFADSVSDRPISSETDFSEEEVDTFQAEEDPELRLVAPDEGSEGAGGADVDDRNMLLDNEIAIVMEQLEAINQENSELQEQVSEAESIISDLERLIELKDDELATLQQSLVDSGIDGDFTDQEMLEDEAGVIEEEVDDFVDTEEVVDDEEIVEEEIISTPGVVVSEPVESTSMVDTVIKTVMDNIMVVGGAILAVILVLVGLVFIKKRRADSDASVGSVEEFADFSDQDDPEAAVETEIGYADEHEQEESEAETVVPMPDGEVSDELIEEVGDDDAEDGEEEHTVFAATPAAEPEAVAEEPEEDALAEVNVFLAYEHFDQAEEFVRDAIKGDPENLEYHSKLLEVFYASGNKPAYEEEARVLNDLVSGEGPHWDMATAMWQEMSPNRALFEEPAEGEEDAAAPAAEAGGGMLDLTAEEGDDAADSADAGLDFDIGGTAPDSGNAEDQLEASSGGTDEDMLDVTAAVGIAPMMSEEAETDEDESSDSADDEPMLDITADDSADEEILDLTAGSDDEVLDMTGEDIKAGEDDEEVLDLTASVSDDVLDMTGADIKEDEDEVLDLTAGSDEEEVLDATSSDEDSDDLLDVSAVSGDDLLDVTAHSDMEDGDAEEDLLDVTSATTAGADASSLLDDEGDDGLSLSLDDSSDEPSLEIESEEDSTDDVLDLTMDDDADDGLELDLSADTDDSIEELSLDDNESSESDGLEIDLSIDDGESDESAADEFSLELDDPDGLDLGVSDDSDDSGVPVLSLDDDDAQSITELDMESTVEIPKHALNLDDDEDDDDEEEHTVFVPRTSNDEEQSEEDEVGTKLDLAKAYVELGDKDSAKTILEEVIAEGNDSQKQQAQALLDQV